MFRCAVLLQRVQRSMIYTLIVILLIIVIVAVLLGLR
jgi:hypothetical protein